MTPPLPEDDTLTSPHTLRTSPRALLALVALLATMLTLVAAPRSASAVGAPSGPKAADDVTIVNLINKERAAVGLPALTINLQLTRLARGHSQAMALGGPCGDGQTLRHRSPLSSGVTANWRKLRENVGCNRPYDVGAIHTALMNSPGHKVNILANDVDQIGVGLWEAADGGLWITQIFMFGGDAPALAPVTEGLVATGQAFAAPDSAPYVVLSRSDVFADSLGGATLAGGSGPILFTDAPGREEGNPQVRPRTRAEIDRVLAPGGTVYLLGGEKAISPAAAAELAAGGYKVVRLGGAGRIETAVMIAQEVVRRFGTPNRVAIASAVNWPDSITGGAAAGRAGVPLLLTLPNSLPAPTAAFLNTIPGAERVVLGGRAAVDDAVTAQLNGRRVSGPGRAETALAVADQLFGQAGDEVVIVEGYSEAAWGPALAWAPYAANRGAPQVIVANGSIPDSVKTWLASRRGQASPRFANGVSASVQRQVLDLLGR